MIKEIVIPDGVEAELNLPEVTIKGTLGEIKNRFDYAGIAIKYVANERKIELRCISKKRNDLAVLGTIYSLINNMIEGVQKGYIFKMECVYAHFPISIKVQGNNVQVQNFLGERNPRKVKILLGVDIKVKGDNITIKGINKEKVAQMAGKLEKACYKGRRDPRKFQDGIYPLGWFDE